MTGTEPFVRLAGSGFTECTSDYKQKVLGLAGDRHSPFADSRMHSAAGETYSPFPGCTTSARSVTC
ncbi:hypothetical protein SBA2_100011 [Acidobacteriia bacterium SbA2]|nr:hypothetical protein SBA2_100011 [Acidobacteriia bacterium SbA2]